MTRLTPRDYASYPPEIQRCLRMLEGAANAGTLDNETRTKMYEALRAAGYPLGGRSVTGAGTPGEYGLPGQAWTR